MGTSCKGLNTLSLIGLVMVLVFQVVDPEGSQAEEAQRVARHQKREHRRVSILD